MSSRGYMPVVLQTNTADCGAACLTMILRRHRYAVSLAEVRARLGVSRDGLNALALVQAGRDYGLVGRAFSVDPADLARVPEAIVHWRFNHFLVLRRWSARQVEVIDPALGRRRMTSAEFDAGFTGVVIVFQPGPGFQPRTAASHLHPWRRRLVRPILLGHRGLWTQALAASLALQVVGLILPVATELIVGHVLGTPRLPMLGILGAGIALAVLCQFVLSYLRNIVLVALRVRADSQLTTGIVAHLFRLPYEFFVRRGAVDLVTRTGSVSVIREMVTSSVLPTLLDGPLAVGYLALIWAHDVALGAFLTVVAVLLVAIPLGSRRRISGLAQQELLAQSAAQSFLTESIKGIETLKAASAEIQAIEQWRRRFAAQLNATVRTRRRMGLVDATVSALQIMAPLGLIWLGAWRVLGGALTMSGMLGLTALGATALAPLSSLAGSLQLLEVAGAHLDRLADIVESEPETTRETGVPPGRLAGGVEVRRLGFRYSPRAPWTLKEVTFSIAPGQKIALVGRSGCGKTTLARILLTLYPATEGEVLYDGIPAEDHDPRWLRGNFGVVSQDPALFTGTIRENICLGAAGASISTVVAAARLACIHEDILRLPMGYETMLSEGDGMSGGQRQRIALARALLTRPRLLVLDEATSHLDAATEAAIETQLSDLQQTRIVIAHRLSTVRDADLILVMDQGTIVEHGTHDELLASGRHYQGLAALQAPSLR